MNNIVNGLLMILFLIFTQNLKAQTYFKNEIHIAKIEYKPLVNYFEYNNVNVNSYLNKANSSPLTIVKSNMYSFLGVATDIVPSKLPILKNHINSTEKRYYSLVKTALSVLADSSLKLTAKSFK